jgi:tetraacyldisaccharide 4'-kinase
VEDKRAVAFSGIGRHDRFIRLLKENGFDIVSEFEFPDHYDYKEKDIRKIVEIFERTSADLIITTEKDYVRLLDSEFLGNYSSLPFFYTVVRIEFISGEEKLKQIINRVIGHA